MLMGQMPLEEAQIIDHNAREMHKGGTPRICGQKNARASVRGSTGQNTDKGHT